MSGYDANTNALRQRINAESAQSEVVRLRDALASARREVETVTRERDEANQKLANLIPMPTERMPADREWAHSEWACNQWYLANEAAMHYKAERDTVQQDLAWSRAALEDVRRVLRGIADHGWQYDGLFSFTVSCVGTDDAKALHEALGRALAQEAGE